MASPVLKSQATTPLERALKQMKMEYRTFHLCDDASANFYIGRIIRAEHEVKPELWALEIGDYLNGDLPGTCYQRAA